MKKIIVTFADNNGAYRRGVTRMVNSLLAFGYNGTFVAYTEFGEIGSPPHKGKDSVPYAFKAYAIKKAVEENGPGLYLWMDSPIYATGSLDPVFDHIEKEGYLFFDNVGFSIASFTSDSCLNHFSMTREEALKKPMLMSCCYGFSTNSDEAMELMRKYIDAADDGVSYHGDWFNNNGQVSRYADVRGHRHDQSVQSILVAQAGLDVTNAQDTFFAYKEHIGQLPIADSVILWSQGIE